MIDNERSEVDTGKDFHFRVYLQDTKINGLFGDISYKRGVKHGGKSAINLSLGTAYEVVKVESNQARLQRMLLQRNPLIRRTVCQQSLRLKPEV